MILKIIFRVLSTVFFIRVEIKILHYIKHSVGNTEKS